MIQERPFIDEDGREFWWPMCSVLGCYNCAYIGQGSDKCYPHTFTGWHHRFIREIRRLRNSIMGWK